MKGITKRIGAMLLAATMAFSVTACGGKSEDSANQPTGVAGEYVYVPEYHTLLAAGESNEGFQYFTAGANRLYLCHSTYDNDVAKQSLCYYNLDNLDESKEFMSFDGIVDEENTIYVNSLIADQNDNVYVLYVKQPYTDPALYEQEDFDWDSYWQEYTKKQETFLCKYSADGEVLYEQNLTDFMRSEQDMYLSDGVVDEAGNLYFSSGNAGIYKFDKDGNMAGKIAIGSDDWVSSMGILPDGNVGVAINGMKNEIKVLNVATGMVEKSYTNLPANCYDPGVASTPDGKILLKTDAGLFAMDPATEENEQLLKWFDSDMNPDYVQNVTPLANGDFLVYYVSWDDNETSLVLMKKTDASTVVVKKTITLACFGSSQSIQNEVVKFNKNSEEYRIEIKDYSEGIDWSGANAEDLYKDARTRFQNDIVSGNAPDMFVSYDMDPKILVKKGVVEDLGPYLDKSEKLQRSDFFESILEANSCDGVLYNLPATFNISTIFARTEDVEEYSKWTMEELKALGEKYPDASIFPNAARDTIFYYLVGSSLDSYVNMETGECNLDSQDFKDVLEICKKYPKEFDWENGYVAEPKTLRDHSSLLYMTSIGDIDSYTIISAMYGCPVTSVGYPGKGIKVNCEGIYISASSQYKDICFSFIEQTLEEESVLSWMSYGFATQKTLFDKQMEEKLKQNGGGSWGWDDVTIEVPKATKEDVDAIKSMIDEVSGVSVYNEQILNIIQEEAEAYFEGQKSLEEVTGIIQNRVKLYVSEMQ